MEEYRLTASVDGQEPVDVTVTQNTDAIRVVRADIYPVQVDGGPGTALDVQFAALTSPQERISRAFVSAEIRTEGHTIRFTDYAADSDLSIFDGVWDLRSTARGEGRRLSAHIDVKFEGGEDLEELED